MPRCQPSAVGGAKLLPSRANPPGTRFHQTSICRPAQRRSNRENDGLKGTQRICNSQSDLSHARRLYAAKAFGRQVTDYGTRVNSWTLTLDNLQTRLTLPRWLFAISTGGFRTHNGKH